MLATDSVAPAAARPRVNLTLPVYNEARQLAASVRRVLAFLAGQPRWSWEVVLADNGSTDGTRAQVAGSAQSGAACPVHAGGSSGTRASAKNRASR